MALSAISDDSMLQAPTNLEQLETIMQSRRQSDYVVPREVGIEKDPQMIAPVIEAKSAIAIDLETGAILYKKNAFERLPIASITKLMTALVAVENIEYPEEFIKVPYEATVVGGASLHLIQHEQLSFKDILTGMIVRSGNDAAITLATRVAGTVEAFVEMMNNRAQDLGLIDTKFANPMGYDNIDNYSTAYELTILAKEALKHDVIKKAARQKYGIISSRTGRFDHEFYSTNKLLSSYLKITGLKTGTTDLAGQSVVLVSEYTKNPVLVVVLNSPDRFQESKVLIDWVYEAYNWPK